MDAPKRPQPRPHPLLAALPAQATAARQEPNGAPVDGDEEYVLPADREWPLHWMRVFLQSLQAIPNVTASARMAGKAKSRVYQVREADPVFAAAWDEALQIARDSVERRAFQWIMTGIPTRKSVTKTKDGAIVETVVTESVETYGPLMIFWLKAWFPDRYRWAERAEVTGEAGGPVQVESLDTIDRQIAELTEELNRRARGEVIPDEQPVADA